MPAKPALKYIPIDQLTANTWNPQTQDEATFNRLVEEMRENGCLVSLTVVETVDGTYRILGGQHRWKAAQQVGLDEVPCIIVTGKRWNDIDLQKFETVRLNAIGGKMDPEKFAKLYGELADKYGKDALQQMFGYSDTRIFQKLVGDTRRMLKKALPKEMGPAIDSATKDAKTFQDITDVVQMMMVKHGDTLPNGWMTFTYGSQEHVYVQLNTKSKRALDKVLNYLRESGENINDFFGPIFDTAAKQAAVLLKAEVKTRTEPEAKTEEV